MRLLLVDDEIFVRERIIRQIDWKNLGIQEVKTAENGVDALRMMAECKPDILISDVRMPQMDGIKLVEEVKRLSSDCKIIFISGFSDVPYLRSAIRLKAINYVEKPIDMEELAQSIRNAVKDIQTDHIAQNGLQMIQQKDESERNASIAKGLTQEETAKKAATLLSEVENPDAYGYFATAIVQILGLSEDQSLSEETALDFVKKSFSDTQVRAIGFLRNDKIILQLFCESSESKRKDVLSLYFAVLANLIEQEGLRCVSVIGRFVKNPGELPLSYDTAMQTQSKCFYKYHGYLGFYQQFSGKPFDLSQLSIAEFSHALKKDSEQALLFLVNSLTTQLKQFNATSPYEVKRFYYAIIMLMLRAAQKENIQLHDSFADEYALLNYINHLDFFDDLHEFTAETIHLYYEKVHNNLTGNAIVNQIIRYLNQNYHNPDLSVTMVSEYVNLSSTYVCHLFKSTLSTTIGDYLTQLRIEKAVEMMQTKNYKIKEIAHKIGYRNGNYFSYRFKKIMGYSPSENAK